MKRLEEAGARNSRKDSERIKTAVFSTFEALTDAEQRQVLKELKRRLGPNPGVKIKRSGR
jgi:hypothetical protein